MSHAGSITAYTNYKCRCRPCRDAWSAYWRKYYRTHPDARDRRNARTAAYKARVKGATR